MGPNTIVVLAIPMVVRPWIDIERHEAQVCWAALRVRAKSCQAITDSPDSYLFAIQESVRPRKRSTGRFTWLGIGICFLIGCIIVAVVLELELRSKNTVPDIKIGIIWAITAVTALPTKQALQEDEGFNDTQVLAAKPHNVLVVIEPSEEQ
jgi:hypothetical protein